jgi:hypothetical protein
VDSGGQGGHAMTTIEGVGPQLERAAAGTDPRGWLVFEYLPTDLQRQEDSTAVADRDQARLLNPRGHVRDATAAEKQLLAHLGHDVPAGLETTVSWPSKACRRRRWPELESTNGGTS